MSLREQFTNLLLQLVAEKRSLSAFFHGVSKTANLLPSCSRLFIASAVTTQRRKHFTQYFGSDALDASLLMMPLTGFLPITDERVRSTIEAIERELMQDGLVLRYRPQEEKVDGLPGQEGVFLPCSFWLADCWHLLGRKKEARELFERLLTLRNDLGLLSEKYDPRTKRQLGNFPQAFSHLVLVTAARILGGETPPFRG